VKARRIPGFYPKVWCRWCGDSIKPIIGPDEHETVIEVTGDDGKVFHVHDDSCWDEFQNGGTIADGMHYNPGHGVIALEDASTPPDPT
jgi:hypothetical protein